MQGIHLYNELLDLTNILPCHIKCVITSFDCITLIKYETYFVVGRASLRSLLWILLDLIVDCNGQREVQVYFDKNKRRGSE